MVINSKTIFSIRQRFKAALLKLSPPQSNTCSLAATLMSKLLSTIILSISMFTVSHGQNFGFGFVTSTGDTLNKKDSLGYWQGLHVSMQTWGCNILNDTCEYQIGYYKDGKPIGNWTDHKKDGSFSVGQYNTGIEVTQDGKGGWTEKYQGIYAKIGVWQYFNRDSILQKTERYDRSSNRKGWTDKIYLQNSSGNFVLIEYKFMNKRNMNSPFKVDIDNFYYEDGKPASFNKRNFWQDGFLAFHRNGQIKIKYKCRKFLGIKTNRSVTKLYSQEGKLTSTKKGKCSTTITDPAF